MDNKERKVDGITATTINLASIIAPTIHFRGNDNREIMRLEPNGNIYVKGNLVENDKEVVGGLRAFLQEHKR